MKYLADSEDNEDVFRLSVVKIKKALALSILNAKKDGYRLKEFVATLEKGYELGIPSSLYSSIVGIDDIIS